MSDLTLEQFLIRHEGKVRHAYQDSLGYWTIGVGRLIDKRNGGGLCEEEIALLLKNDIAKCNFDLERHLPWSYLLSRVRYNVLIAMRFQLGLKGLLKFKATLAAMERGDYKAAARGMLASKWARQTPARAKEMAKMMELGE